LPKWVRNESRAIWAPQNGYWKQVSRDSAVIRTLPI
jgi:hypothetical protein